MRYSSFILIACALLISGCNASRDNLVFVDTNVLGVSASSPTAGGASLKVGYASFDYFNVPVVRTAGDGEPVVLTAKGPTGLGRDAFSAVAFFDSTTGNQQLCVGRAAAVGIAAQELARNAGKRC